MAFGTVKFMLGAVLAAFLALGSLQQPASWGRVLAIIAAVLSAVVLVAWLWRRRGDVEAMFEANRQRQQAEYDYGGEPWKKVRAPKSNAASLLLVMLLIGFAGLFLYFTYFGDNDALTSRRASVHLLDALFGSVFGNSMVGWKTLTSVMSVFFFVGGVEFLVALKNRQPAQAGSATSGGPQAG